MTNLAQLLEQRAQIDAQIEAAKTSTRKEGIEKVQAILNEYGLTIADLGPFTATAKKAKTSTSSVAVKYRHPTSGEAWTGRGMTPKWLKAELAAGKTREDFAV